MSLSGRWDGLDVGVTAFDIEKSNVLTTDPNDVNFLAPVGSLRSRGVELDASLRMGQRWQAVANFVWNEGRNNDDTFATPLALNVPDQSGTVFVAYCSDAGQGREWSLSGGVSYVGERSGELTPAVFCCPAIGRPRRPLNCRSPPTSPSGPRRTPSGRTLCPELLQLELDLSRRPANPRGVAESRVLSADNTSATIIEH